MAASRWSDLRSGAPLDIPQNPGSGEASVEEEVECERPHVGERRALRPRHDCEHHGSADCCSQLVELLVGRGRRSLDEIDLHKPKTSTRAKVSCLCGNLPTRDAIVPMLATIFARFDRQSDPLNEWEGALFKSLAELSDEGRDALGKAFKAVRDLPARTRDCLFDDRYDDLSEDTAITPGDFLVALTEEGIASVAETFFPRSGGMMGPGKVRLWERTLRVGLDGSPDLKVTAPWPWINAVRPSPDRPAYEFRNNTYRPKLDNVQEHEWAQTCTFTLPNPNNPSQIIETCTRTTPSGAFAICDGGLDYTVNVGGAVNCLSIPMTVPGQSIAFRGFNFIAEPTRVRLVKDGDPSVHAEVRAALFGDLETPVNDPQGAVIADGRASDMLLFDVPAAHPSSPGQPLPPGRYLVTVLVPNALSIVIDGTVPADLESNTMLIDVEPDPDVSYRIWSDHGHCYDETSGWGSDEIWWDAWVGTANLTDPPGAGALPDPQHLEIDRDAWSDMDSGEDPGAFAIDFLKGKLGLGGMAVVGLIGFEVDSEDAAKEQIRSFGEAYVYYLKQAFMAAVGLEGTAAAVAKLISLTLTQGLIVLAVIAALVLVIGLFWASWAAPDRVAVDIFIADAKLMWNLTDPTTPMPPDEFDRYHEIRTRHLPREKRPAPLSASTVYTAEHRYRSMIEDSDYGLEIRYSRS